MVLWYYFYFLLRQVFNSWTFRPRQVRCKCQNIVHIIRVVASISLVTHPSLQSADENGSGERILRKWPYSINCVQFSYCTTLTTSRCICYVKSQHEFEIFRNGLNVTNIILQLICCGRQKWTLTDRHRKLSFHRLKPVICSHTGNHIIYQEHFYVLIVTLI